MKNLFSSFSKLVKLIAITCLLISARQSMASCVASFTYVIDTATRTVTFTSTSTGTNPYVQWRFIDEWVYGNTYTRQFNPGYHYVCLYLTSSTDTSCHSTVCDSIFIPGSVPCHASISYPINNGTKPGIYFFAGYPSTGANLVYDWTFSGGTEAWPLSSPALKNRYLDAGIYTVCLTVTNILDSTCHDDTCVTVVVDTPYCYANFTFTADTTMVSPVYYFQPFNTDSGNTYSWTFTNVATGSVDSSTAKSPTKIITNNTAYVMVCLTITNSIKGCTETFCDSLFPGMITGLRQLSAPVKINSLYPNPASNVIHSDFYSDRNGEAELMITNLLGQVLVRRKLTVTAGENTIESGIHELDPGMYFLQLKTENGYDVKQFCK